MSIDSITAAASAGRDDRWAAAREAAARRLQERSEAPRFAPVEVVRPVDPQTRMRADTEVLGDESTTGPRRLDISV